MLAHIADLEGALEELARVLRPGGHMAIGETNAESVYVVGWEPLVRGVKRAVGAPLSARTRTPRGIEEWFDDGKGGGILVRRLDASFLVRFLAERHVELVDRVPTHLARAKLPALRRIVDEANRWYVDLHGPASLALGNLFIFQKRRSYLAA